MGWLIVMLLWLVPSQPLHQPAQYPLIATASGPDWWAQRCGPIIVGCYEDCIMYCELCRDGLNYRVHWYTLNPEHRFTEVVPTTRMPHIWKGSVIK